MKYCGRQFSEQEVAWLRDQISQPRGINRRQLSMRFCEQFEWRKPDGGLKDMSCRVVLLKMNRDGLLELPAPQKRANKARVEWTLLGEPRAEVCKPAGQFELCIELVDPGTSSLWRELIERYHYLGYAPLAGAQLRYWVQSQEGPVALLSFSAAAWKTAPRDQYIGWDSRLRKENLRLVVNNSRFLVLPWIRSKCLASRILAGVIRRLADDWQKRYGYRPALVETFVEKQRFQGTCYKAAGWICVGETRGRGKLDRYEECKLPVKTVWLYGLEKNFRRRLLGERP
jgi:Domain of unknown function (DUF4338)